jgi:hypothetical protein
MATSPGPTPPRQLLLDVERPIVMRPRRERSPATGTRPVPPVKQMEFIMAQSAAEPALYPPIVRAPPVVPVVTVEAAGARSCEPFGAWLLEQSKRGGMLGELAKAVKLDRQFPKTGSVKDVRRHFGSIGAEGDAFEALNDAEREYDRL